ncbi:MAG: winged helix-turn-helix transcriptional regulator [Clostridia bacterium]|nr:winged helix-turn-helix transcriptional regulator [Clostridia bacterium]
MMLEWMGENRGVVEALIHYCNIYAAVCRKEKMEYRGVRYSYSQIQVLEYLLETDDRGDNMASVAKRLGITRSNFTKIVNKLTEKGLTEKRCLPGCRRDHCVEVTPFGRELYADYSADILKRHFAPMFAELDKLTPEARDTVRDALMGSLRADYLKEKKEKGAE